MQIGRNSILAQRPILGMHWIIRSIKLDDILFLCWQVWWIVLASAEIGQRLLGFTRGISPAYSTTMLGPVCLYTIELNWMPVNVSLRIDS